MSISYQPTFAEIAASCGYELKDLAQAMEVTRSALVFFEQYPPKKWMTWLQWVERFLKLPPFLGEAFTDIFQSRAFAKCPSGIIDHFWNRYLEMISGQYESGESDSFDFSPRVGQDEQDYLQKALYWDSQGYWDEAERWIVKAIRLRPISDSLWLYYRLVMTQFRINKGELISAEELLSESQLRHQLALQVIGKTPDYSNQALAKDTYAWLLFLRGENERAVQQFIQAIDLARIGGNIDFLHTGLHMGTRALVEPNIFRLYFQIELKVERLDTILAIKSLRNIDTSLNLDYSGSLREAFGIWYKAILTGLSSDFDSGKKLLIRSQKQIQNNSEYEVNALSHAGLSMVHFDILSSDRNPYTFQKHENRLQEIFRYVITYQKYPLALADALVTIAFCRIQQGISYQKIRQETADFLCLALIIYPHVRHVLWQVGMSLLSESILPSMDDMEYMRYINSLVERVHAKVKPFHYLSYWNFDLQSVETLVELLKFKAN